MEAEIVGAIIVAAVTVVGGVTGLGWRVKSSLSEEVRLVKEELSDDFRSLHDDVDDKLLAITAGQNEAKDNIAGMTGTVNVIAESIEGFKAVCEERHGNLRQRVSRLETMDNGRRKA